jgi:hypothetical protein
MLKKIIIDSSLSLGTVAASAVVGYAYGAFFKVNKKVAAQAFAVSQFVFCTSTILNVIVTKGPEANPKSFYAIQILITVALGIVEIIAFRRLNLIASLGTVFLAANVMYNAASNLSGLYLANQVKNPVKQQMQSW